MVAWFPHALLSILEQRLLQSREPGSKELGTALRQVILLRTRSTAHSSANTTAATN